MECPYCTCDALVRLEPKEFRNPDFIHFHDAGGYDPGVVAAGGHLRGHAADRGCAG